MKRRLLTLAVLVATSAFSGVPVAAVVSAQTVERSFDLSSLGWGMISAELVNTDDDPTTEEWAVQGFDGFFGNYGLWRVVAIRPSGACIGPWFDPRPNGSYAATVTLQKEGRARLVVSDTSYVGWQVQQTLTVVRLDTPTCTRE